MPKMSNLLQRNEYVCIFKTKNFVSLDLNVFYIRWQWLQVLRNQEINEIRN